MIESSEQRSTNSFLFNLAIEVLLFTIFGMLLITYMVIGFYIIFGIGCGIAFVTTNSLIGEFLILSIAGPTSTPCAAPA